jgi:hypothetical protein
MAQSNLAFVRRERRYGGLGLILAGVLAGSLAIGPWSSERRDDPTPVAGARSTQEQPRARAASPVPAVAPEAPKPSPTDERRRRLLITLMTNGAGPLRPYGGLGR